MIFEDIIFRRKLYNILYGIPRRRQVILCPKVNEQKIGKIQEIMPLQLYSSFVRVEYHFSFIIQLYQSMAFLCCVVLSRFCIIF